MTDTRETYPRIRGVDPDLLKEYFVINLPEYPSIQTYCSRGIYDFQDVDLTVTIKPHIPDSVFKQSDPEDITEPEGWKIMVNNIENPINAAEGNTIYESPDHAIRAVEQAAETDLKKLSEEFGL